MSRYLLLSSTLALACLLSAAPVLTTGLDERGSIDPVVMSPDDGFAAMTLSNGVQFKVNGVTKNVIFYGPRTVRVNATLGDDHWQHPSLVVIQKPEALKLRRSENGKTLTLRSEAMRVEIDKASGAVAFFDATGRLLTREKSESPQQLREVTISGAPTYEASNTFLLKPEEAIYGFGYLGGKPMNRRGQDLLLVQTNIGIVIPVMVSTEGYGVLWDTYSKMTFADSADGATLWAESAPGGVDYYVFAGDTFDEVIAGYRDLTGEAPMFPKQAFGLFMSKERYRTQERLLEVAKTFRTEGFPLDYIVQDWQYWGSDTDGTWSGMSWNPARFPEPEKMTQEIHDLNLKLMVSIWPSVGNDTALAHELDEHGLRFEPLHWISKKARIYDAFSPLGRNIYYQHIEKGLLDVGVDALWMDGTEVEVGTACWDPGEVERDIKRLGTNAMGDFTRYLNPYSLMTTLGTYEGQRARGDQRVFTLTRSAWAGAQRTAAASWSGDIFASWATLREQIGAGLSVTATGNPYWTNDIGGFFVQGANFPGGEHNPAYRELFARWYQFGAFNPLFRVHGTSIEREPYIFKELDPEVYASLLQTTHLRYRLLPYLYSEAWQITSADSTLMRPLALDFPADRATYGIDDAFMFGPALLVHPVTRAMYRVPPPPATTIPASALRTPDGAPGLAVQYFAGENFESPAGKSVDTQIDYVWPGPPLANPPPGLESVNDFSARWEGRLTAPESGEYEIGADYDDGMRIYLDGQLLVEDWGYGARRYRGGKITLQAGQQVDLRVDFHQGAGERAFRLTWRTPSEAKALAEAVPEIDNHQSTYLPKGNTWYDFWTNQRHAGGQNVTAAYPLDRFPLFVRAGTILPLGPVVQYATEQPAAPYEIRIYPGADGQFVLYEDDNETYAYERGERATYTLTWNDKKRTLQISAREGSFPGLVERRELRIVVVKPGQKAGLDPATTEVRTVVYEGKSVTVRF